MNDSPYTSIITLLEKLVNGMSRLIKRLVVHESESAELKKALERIEAEHAAVKKEIDDVLDQIASLKEKLEKLEASIYGEKK